MKYLLSNWGWMMILHSIHAKRLQNDIITIILDMWQWLKGITMYILTNYLILFFYNSLLNLLMLWNRRQFLILITGSWQRVLGSLLLWFPLWNRRHFFVLITGRWQRVLGSLHLGFSHWFCLAIMLYSS